MNRKPQRLKDFAIYYLSNFSDDAKKEGIALNDLQVQTLPSNKQKIGDILIVSIPDSLSHKKNEIGKLFLKMDSNARLVLNDSGIFGPFRIPRREIIASREELKTDFESNKKPDSKLNSNSNSNSKSISQTNLKSILTETVHKENGCLFKLDVSKIMFSKGNLAEKRLLTADCKDEVIVDMFAGIGYFSIPIAVHSKPKRIIAIELNPVSYGYLCDNIRLNGLESIVEPICGDCLTNTPEYIADRVLMGYVGTTHDYLEAGIKAVKKEGGLLHYHETVHEKDFPNRAISRIRDAAQNCNRKAVILESRKIKKYSPGVYHVVTDAKIL